jgi:hypothetical protein
VNNASIWQVCKFEEVEDVNNFRPLMVNNYKPFSVVHTNLGQNKSSNFVANFLNNEHVTSVFVARRTSTSGAMCTQLAMPFLT